MIQNLNRNIILGSIACVIVAAVTFGIINGVYKRNISNINNAHNVELLSMQHQKDSIKHHADSIDYVLTQKTAKFDSLVKVDKYHKSEIDRLRMELLGAYNELFDNWTADAHYKALQTMFPTNDSLVFPFSGNQVKEIHIAIVAGQYKDSLIIEYEMSDSILRRQISVNLSKIDVLNIARQDLTYLNTKLINQLAVKTQENKLSQEEITELKKKLRKWRLGGVGAAGFAALALILL